MEALLQNDYEVRIGAFEGPMDLLLYLVQKNEVKPESISIAEITNQYLEWIKDLSQALSLRKSLTNMPNEPLFFPRY